jgi:hypothetical protein
MASNNKPGIDTLPLAVYFGYDQVKIRGLLLHLVKPLSRTPAEWCRFQGLSFPLGIDKYADFRYLSLSLGDER